jgi:hypothetical protein
LYRINRHVVTTCNFVRDIGQYPYMLCTSLYPYVLCTSLNNNNKMQNSRLSVPSHHSTQRTLQPSLLRSLDNLKLHHPVSAVLTVGLCIAFRFVCACLLFAVPMLWCDCLEVPDATSAVSLPLSAKSQASFNVKHDDLLPSHALTVHNISIDHICWCRAWGWGEMAVDEFRKMFGFWRYLLNVNVAFCAFVCAIANKNKIVISWSKLDICTALSKQQ